MGVNKQGKPTSGTAETQGALMRLVSAGGCPGRSTGVGCHYLLWSRMFGLSKICAWWASGLSWIICSVRECTLFQCRPPPPIPGSSYFWQLLLS